MNSLHYGPLTKQEKLEIVAILQDQAQRAADEYAATAKGYGSILAGETEAKVISPDFIVQGMYLRARKHGLSVMAFNTLDS